MAWAAARAAILAPADAALGQAVVSSPKVAVRIRWSGPRGLGSITDDRSSDVDGLPAEIDFGKGIRGLHHVPSAATTMTPGSGRQCNTPAAMTDELKPETQNQ